MNKCAWQLLYKAMAMHIAILFLSACAHDPYSVVIIDAAGSNSSETHTYKVKKGDTLYSIAFRHDITVGELARLNSIQAPHTIFIGQELLVNGRSLPSHTASVKNRSATVAKTPTKVVVKPKPVVKSIANPSVVAKPALQKKTAVQAKAMTKNTQKWQSPVPLKVSRGFSQGKQVHKGIDYLGSKGTVITSAKSGKVVYAGSGLKAYGLLIIIKHDEQYLSAYAYNQRILVKEGDMVEQGQKIAEMGEKAGKALLHFEIRKNGKPVNPLVLLGK